jgi:uncharacterized protein (TIRG00374 family)
LIKKLRNRIFLSVAFAGLIYLGFMIYFDFDKVLSSFENFDWILLPLLLILSLGNYFSRFLKWQYYLKIIDVKIQLIDSLSIFMSGLIMSVTPGKLGELLKAYLIKQVNNTPISKTAPIIFAERTTDFLSLTIMALIGAYFFNYGTNVVIVIAALIVLAILIVSNRKLSEKLLTALSKIKFLQKHITKMYNAYESSFKLLSLIPLISMTLLSVISWGFECLGYYFILTHFEPKIDIIWAFFSYSFSTIVGAVSMLPGGLGVTEGSLTLMIMKQGLSSSKAFASTFIVRAVTLWFAVLIGAVSVLFYQKRFGNITVDLSA